MSTTTRTVNIGDKFTSPMADTIVTFKVTKIAGERVTATAIPEPFEVDGVTYPGDYDGMTCDFLLDHVAEATSRAKALADLFNRAERTADAFWTSRQVGDILHWNNYGNAWVRGEVILHDGAKALRPTALVGSWQSHDLPQRRPDGTIYHPYHVQKIIDGKAWTPSFDCLWEGGSTAMTRRPDPTGQPPLDLTLPDPTPEEAAEHAREALLNSINLATTAPHSSADRLAQIRALLTTAEVA